MGCGASTAGFPSKQPTGSARNAVLALQEPCAAVQPESPKSEVFAAEGVQHHSSPQRPLKCERDGPTLKALPQEKELKENDAELEEVQTDVCTQEPREELEQCSAEGAEDANDTGHVDMCSIILTAKHEVLSFCCWQQRASMAMLNSEWRRSLGLPLLRDGDMSVDGNYHWRFMCDRLSEEHNIHVPRPEDGAESAPPPLGIASSWRSLFYELFETHCLKTTTDSEQSVADKHFSIKVAAKFRSADLFARVSKPEDTKNVVLPLHQKIQIICDRDGCTKKEAMQIIMRERGRKPTDDPFGTSALCRIGSGCPTKGAHAPPKCVQANDEELTLEEEEDDSENEDEQPEDFQVVDAKASILAVHEDAGTVLGVAPGVGIQSFQFDQVFGERANQKETYELCARRLVMDFLNGTSASIICYGQTGSGKTFTMFGPADALDDTNPGWATQHGIVPRACEEALVEVRARRARGVKAQLGISYVEAFGSEVTDLLRGGQVVGQGQDGRYSQVRATDRVGHRYVLDGHTECHVDSWAEVRALLEQGDAAKRRAATAMNERSTRAHTLLVLSLKQTCQSGVELRSRLFMADLGGSERVSKSKTNSEAAAPVTVVGGVEMNRVGWQEYYERRKRIQETLQINKGLFALKKVIDALHQRSQLLNQSVPPHALPYVPYQDSKLTMLLQESLGGRSRTLVLCTATMDAQHAGESLQTLRFGQRCAQVQKQQGTDTAAAVQAALRQLADEIKAVEAEIIRKERWETRLERRRDVDTIGGAFGTEEKQVVREEVVHKQVVVGAENERELLERLLQRQKDLEGLGGAPGLQWSAERDYRAMAAGETQDGGRGTDFRHQDRFRGKMKARDFEDELVLADGLRFLFRKAEKARDAFGENEDTCRRRLPGTEIHENYFELARWFRAQWEDATAAGTEHRPFGKAMMDRCQEWAAAFKGAPSVRSAVLEQLLAEAPITQNRVDTGDVD